MAVWLILLIAPPTPHDRPARAAVERAITAHGGAALVKAARLRRTDTGTIDVAGKPLPFTRRVAHDLPGRLLHEIEVDGRIRTRLALDGDRGHQSDGGPAAALLPPRLREVRDEAHAAWVATLLPLRRAEVTLKSLPDGGVMASMRGRPDVTLWFAKDTGLLARMKCGDTEHSFDGYKMIGGLRLPTKETVRVSGGVRWTFTTGEHTFPAALEASLFARP